MLVGGGFGLLIGSWTGAPRMIKAISQDYSSLGPRRSIAALIPLLYHRTGRGLLRHPGLVQRDHRQRDHRGATPRPALAVASAP